MRYHFNAIFITLFLSSTFFSCIQQRTNTIDRPSAYGKVDNIMVVVNEETWTTTIGDSFKNHFEAPYPVTPRAEPIYDLHHKTPKQFKKEKY